MSTRKRVEKLEDHAEEVGRAPRFGWQFKDGKISRAVDKGTGLFKIVNDILDYLGVEYKYTPAQPGKDELVKATKTKTPKAPKVTKKAKK